MSISRSQLLGRGSGCALRPPWLADPDVFTEACTRCGRCMELCPQQIIRRGTGGFPEIDFNRGECTFCGECTTDCEAQLFQPESGREPHPWSHRAAISERCLTYLGVMCRSCEDACESRAIRFPPLHGSAPRPRIDLQACTGCGACIRPCPQNAIGIT